MGRPATDLPASAQEGRARAPQQARGADRRTGGPPARRDRRRGDPAPVGVLRARIAAVVSALTVYTVACLLVPDVRLSVFSPDLRVMIESIGLCVALFTALALMLPDAEGRVEQVSRAFIAALLTLGLSNAVFGIGPLLLVGETAAGSRFTFYPWLVARYVAGLLFILATLRAPQLSLRAYLLLTAVALAVANAGALVFNGVLPVPLILAELEQARGGMTVDVSSIVTLIGAIAVPAALFILGAWLAWDVFLRSASPLYMWVSLALWVQVFVHIHEALYPTILGPLITSADLLQVLVLVLLLTGAVLKVRTQLFSRGAALRGQAEDLRSQRRLLAAMSEFTEREEAFRSVVTHELATPIATLRGFARLLSKDPGTFPAEARAEALRGMAAEAERLQVLVGRIEELRALELDDFACDLRPVLLGPLLSDAALYVQGLPGNQHVMVAADEVRVLADPLRFGQALRNLLTNAVRYAAEDSPILLEGRAVGAGMVHVVVSDDGPGVPVEERERILGKYQRGRAGQGAQGAGLGLYVAARIAAAHGGQVFFTDPQELSGARVVLEVKAAT